MLIRNRSLEARHFVCPSDGDVTPQDDVKHGGEDDDEEFNYDFASANHVSYSYVCPITSGFLSTPGISVYTPQPARVAVFADKSPTVSGNTITPCQDNMSSKDIRNNMSQNHSQGEAINVLWADFHATRESHPDIGIDQDNIYTAGGSNGPSRSSTSTSGSEHKREEDSFLIGPNY